MTGMNLIQKTRDDYNKIARHFSATRQYNWSELNQFKPLLVDGQYILDWGCGNGRLLTFLSERAINYVGVDQSQELLKLARRNFTAQIKKRTARFYCTAHREQNFPPATFDLVFMIASFHHLPDEKSRLKLLKKVIREMKPTARLILTVWNLKTNWAKQKMTKDWKQLGPTDFLVPWKNNKTGEVEVERYYHHFSKSELELLLKKAGFEIDYNGLGLETSLDRREERNLVVVARKI